ncbi:MAG: serine/threonine-protein kinase [Gemmataceae bacterium]
MPTHTPERSSQLLSHIHTDQSERWRRGEVVRVEHYLALYPDLAGQAEALLDLIDFELRHRRENGEHPPLDEYLSRFPQLGDAVRRIWESSQRDETPKRSESSVLATTAAGPTEELYSSRRPSFAPTLPGFEMQEKLGESGMGVVYKARDLRLNQFRAIKFIRAAVADEAAQERFGREAKAAARLDHPGVVRIHAMGEHEGELFICMEYLEGGNLHARLRQGMLDFRAAAELLRQLALAVQHAHDHKVLHRDLKPANVLLTVAGAPKVADFGLAKLLDEDDGLTRIGDVMGTPSYMAPEQAEGRVRDVGETADIWALGAILYECLTGRPPFKGEGRGETMELVKKRPPTLPRRLRAEVPSELEAVCLKCLEKRSEDRYATAAELADDLQAWLDGKPIRLAPKRTQRRLTVALTLLLLAAAAGGAFALRFGHQPQPDAAPVAGLPLAPGVWHPLLTQEPISLHWPDREKNAYKNYFPEKREIQLSCKERGMLALGATSAPSYQFAVTVDQTPWVGNIGVFIGYQHRLVEGKPSLHYQLLELTSENDVKRGPLLRIYWKKHSLVDRNWSFDEFIASAPFPAIPSDHRLELRVGPGGLEWVKWDGQKLNRLCAERLERAGQRPPPPLADYKGTFGIYAYQGSGTFRDAQYRFEEEP